jgi:hypothetical protein
VFAATGGSSSPSTPGGTSAPPVTKAGLRVTEATAGTNEAVAETTGGTAHQRRGGTHDPFEPLPSSVKAALAASGAPSKATAPTASNSSSGGGSTSSGHGTSAPPAGKGEATTPKTVTPPKEKTVIHYSVAVEFGKAATSAGAPAQLKSYPALKLDEPLPAQNPQLVYLGVTLKTGKYAVFALTGEAILNGAGKCLPSTTHCQAVELAAGQTETLETFEPGGQPVNYQLKVATITRSVTTASGASVSTAGSHLLKSSATLPIDGVRYSSQNGVLAAAVR